MLDCTCVDAKVLENFEVTLTVTLRAWISQRAGGNNETKIAQFGGTDT